MTSSETGKVIKCETCRIETNETEVIVAGRMALHVWICPSCHAQCGKKWVEVKK